MSGGCARLLASPPERGHRPSADVLLRSAATDFGAACCGVVLSGTMNDGAAGLAAVRQAGGLALVQDPAEAKERTQRFFDGDYGIFRGDLRRGLIFGRHDLVQDPPISRIDLLTCRNTLMYFTAEVQAKVLASFQFALNPGGYLFLGKPEALVTRTQMFEVVDLAQHILRKEGAAIDVMTVTPADAVRPGATARSDGHRPLESLFEQNVVPQVMLDASGNLVHANRAARRMFSIGSAQLGRHLREAELYHHPADLRMPVEEVQRERRPIAVYDVPFRGHDGVRSLDIIVAPLDGPSGLVISFLDASRYQDLHAELENSRYELKTAYEELQSTVEELETTNEEFQSTNEELETTNEELYSTNEELETMNEELQSTNEELETINNELRDRSAEVTELNQFLGSILSSFQSAVVVLGTEIPRWRSGPGIGRPRTCGGCAVTRY